MTMSQLKYTELLKNYKNPDEIRKRIKERYWESYKQKKDAYRTKHGLENFKETKKIKKKISYGLYSEIAREFGCQPNTVKKFAHRKNPRALDKTPKNIVVVNPVPEDIHYFICAVKIWYKRYIGASKIQGYVQTVFKRKLAVDTINNHLKKEGLFQPKRKRLKAYEKKRLGERWIDKYREKHKPFRRIQIDLKDMIDIPHLKPLIQARIFPRYLHVAKDVVSGMVFLSLSREKSHIASCRFVALVLHHLSFNDVPLCEVAIQTDNGSEFIQSIFAKFESHFQYLIEKVANAEYRRIPVGKKEYNGSVENFNKYVEYEFLALEDFDNNLDLTVKKFYSYQVDYNTERIYDYGLKKQTPLSYLKGHDQRINTAIAYFPVCVLDQDFRDIDKRLTPEYYQKLKLLKTNKVLYNNFKHQTLHDVGGLFTRIKSSKMTPRGLLIHHLK